LNLASSSYVPAFSDLRSLVSCYFVVQDAYVDIYGVPVFVVSVEPLEQKFRQLLSELSKFNLLAAVRRNEDKLAIRVIPKPVVKPARIKMNIALFVVTVATIVITGYEIWSYNRLWKEILSPNANPFLQAAIFAACMMGIIGLHEFGHKIACRVHGLDATLPYFIPGPPPSLGGLGTFGAVISLRGVPVNKNQLFDIGIAGPVLGFLATIFVFILSIAMGATVSETQAAVFQKMGLISFVSWPSSPLLLILLSDLIGTLGVMSVPPGQMLILAQVEFAAEIGALITFLNILPIWQLDGGHISRAVFGAKGHRIATIVGIAVLLVSGYGFFAIFLLIWMLANRQVMKGVEPLDDVSPLTLSRKLLFLAVLGMLVLCFATPFATSL
jgi:membrane-associated protease RseP (regulator of RpoE activity)